MYRKSLSVLVFGVCVAVAGSAAAGDVQFGLKGGVNRAETTLENPPSDQDRSPVVGIGGGVVLSFGLGGSVGIDTDLLYLQKGVHTEALLAQQDDWESGIETDLALDYVVLAPLLRVGGRGESLSPYFFGGPELGYLVTATHTEAVWYGSPGSGKQENEFDISDYLESTAWGWAVGAGLEFPGESVSAFVEGRWAQGASNIWTKEHTQAWGEEKPRGVYLFGGLRF
ncbi:MAG: outer membrane beta-barrel protein [Candidatus Eisenbacteria bacterium]|nr:outer membrane beta-barrel protein [Candidatus Latescibacterota bacterium]MBD3302138.1 outer membrane beta-barrel protein [Candidatus Eisenbacteria bacterium]